MPTSPTNRTRVEGARRRWVVPGILVAITLTAVGVGALLLVTRGRTDSKGLPRTDSRVVASGGGPAMPGAPAGAYHARYRVTDRPLGSRQPAATTSEEDWVRRPFDGRRETSAGGKVSQVTVWSLSRFEVRNAGASTPQTLVVAPGPAGNDLRPDAVRVDAVAAGYFEPREHRIVAGHRCQVFRTLQGAQTGRLEPVERNGDLASDVCFDDRGVLVEEVGYDHGTIVHRKVLTALEVDAPIADDLFTFTGTNLDLKHGGGSIRPLEPTSRPPGASFYELDGPPPAGFVLQGRYAVVPPQPEAFSDPTKYDSRQAGVVDVYTRGADFLLVDRGGTVGGADPFVADPTAAHADLGTLGQAEIILGMTGSEVRVDQGGGHYLRVSGSLPADQLLDVMRHLAPQPGGELRFLDAG